MPSPSRRGVQRGYDAVKKKIERSQVCLNLRRTLLHKINVSSIREAPVKEEGARGVTIKWLINEKDGAPTFLMRHFTVEPGGFTPFHSHDWEHEIYILEGSGKVRYEDREEHVEPGDAILIPRNKRHQFQASSVRPLKFICMIPK